MCDLAAPSATAERAVSCSQPSIDDLPAMTAISGAKHDLGVISMSVAMKKSPLVARSRSPLVAMKKGGLKSSAQKAPQASLMVS
jgi:hypothetical protein